MSGAHGLKYPILQIAVIFNKSWGQLKENVNLEKNADKTNSSQSGIFGSDPECFKSYTEIPVEYCFEGKWQS